MVCGVGWLIKSNKSSKTFLSNSKLLCSGQGPLNARATKHSRYASGISHVTLLHLIFYSLMSYDPAYYSHTPFYVWLLRP